MGIVEAWADCLGKSELMGGSRKRGAVQSKKLANGKRGS